MRWPERIFVICIFLSIALLFVFTAEALDIDNNSVFYEEVNKIRLSRGLGTLDVDKAMEKTAVFYSGVCSSYGKISHDYIDDGSIVDTYLYYGGADYDYLGEILQSGQTWAMTDFKKVVSNFMNSPRHKALIMHEDIEAIGVGYLVADGKIFLTAYVGRYE